ncbi:hypothetical protein M0R72_18150 [Candidatus Pacearchaeota archaeon]|jgi:hypothetical protein|nr:hypothetical protein [Candidatus Pacearchaeota archaeon]
MSNKITVTEAMREIRNATAGQCPGCTRSPSWEHTISGTVRDNPSIWACCPLHDTSALSYAISADAYAVVSNAAKKEKMSIDALIASDYCR